LYNTSKVIIIKIILHFLILQKKNARKTWRSTILYLFNDAKTSELYRN